MTDAKAPIGDRLQAVASMLRKEGEYTDGGCIGWMAEMADELDSIRADLGPEIEKAVEIIVPKMIHWMAEMERLYRMGALG